MKDFNTVKFSHFKSVDSELIKIIYLYVISEISVWIKAIEERSKDASYELSQVPTTVATLNASKESDGAILSLIG